ncbi:MAG: hypothetical protein O3C62_00955 [Actinomycetota bacterium]|nr:hypothetical protein [Actinomycetota bacterium]MDA2971642.1 hypothetical protein [Actinomycetota bacterium]MDA3000234.1 hypothetical protein [Actinomycetota bacterium]
MASKKRRAKRRKKSASKVPFVLLVAVMGSVGALLVVSAQNSISGDSSSPTSPDTTLAESSVPDVSAPADDESEPAVTIGSVAPPVSIDTDDEDDDHNDTAFVLDDYTPTETPEPPSSPRTISDGSIDDGRVTGTIPDGFYLGYIDGVASSTSLLIRFDASDGPTYATPIDDLLFVSLRVDARDPSHPGSAVVAADTLVRLVEQGRAAYSIPESDDFVVIEGSYLITVADGRLVGIEGLS